MGWLEDQKRRDEERREFHADAEYEAWRSGLGEPDYDRVEDHFYRGGRPDDAVREMAEQERVERERREQERYGAEAEELRQLQYAEEDRRRWEEEARMIEEEMQKEQEEGSV